jgi:hypothetical protein
VTNDLSTLSHDSANLTRTRPALGDPDIEQYLELLLGPKDDGSAFSSDESRRISWRSHAADVMRLVHPGSRPWAWWEYDAPEPARPGESEPVYLARWGLLTEAEQESLAQATVHPVWHATRNP